MITQKSIQKCTTATQVLLLVFVLSLIDAYLGENTCHFSFFRNMVNISRVAAVLVTVIAVLVIIQECEAHSIPNNKFKETKKMIKRGRTSEEVEGMHNHLIIYFVQEVFVCIAYIRDYNGFIIDYLFSIAPFGYSYLSISQDFIKRDSISNERYHLSYYSL